MDSSDAPVKAPTAPKCGLAACQITLTKLNEGTGPTVPKGSLVTCHYHGTLPDGTVFDSSVDKGKPFKFQLGVGAVIKGWDDGFA